MSKFPGDSCEIFVVAQFTCDSGFQGEGLGDVMCGWKATIRQTLL